MDSHIKKLCKQAQKGDKDAACELLRIYYADVYSYLRRLCGSRADAEDLTQQTFLKGWSSLGSFGFRCRFSTWIYRIARNTLIDWQRKNAGSARTCTEQWWRECIDSNPGPFSNTAEYQLAERLYKIVDQLDEDKKQVVHLHYYQGLSIKETAKVLNIATSTVKYRLREVIKILKTKVSF